MDASAAVGGYLRRQHFEHVPVWIAEIEAAAAATAIDLHVVKRAGAAAISNSVGAHALEDLVELRLIDLEGVVVALEVRIVVEIERQRVASATERSARGDLRSASPGCGRGSVRMPPCRAPVRSCGRAK